MSGSVWIASYVLLWLAVLALGAAVLALLRQIGVLHARLRPLGGHPAGEGLDVGAVAPPLAGIDYSRSRQTVIAFTSPTCTVCATLMPSIEALRRQYRDTTVQTVEHGPGTSITFDAFQVSSTPYIVIVNREGAVTAKGVANSLEQVEVMLEQPAAT